MLLIVHFLPKARKKNTGSFSIAIASLEAKSIEIISTIPDKVNFDYSTSNMKSNFGRNGKILPNLRTNLLDNLEFLYLYSKTINSMEFTKTRTYKKPLNEVFTRINKQIGTSMNIKSYILKYEITTLQSILPLERLKNLIISVIQMEEVDSYLLAIQMAILSTTTTFKQALEFKLYLRDKNFFNELIGSINTTRHEIEVKEKKKYGSSNKKSLLIEFPSVNEMSNGQRDILSFISQIQKAKRIFKKQHCILVIDEIFDYLDDANLVAFQYYIINLIEEFKSQQRFLYPILLTHLDPIYFQHFSFKQKHRLQIKYLSKDMNRIPSVFLNLVKNRDNPIIKDKVSRYHFHFHPDEINLESEFQNLSLRKAWGKSHNFYKTINDEINNYFDNNDYDSIAVLLAVRIQIEKLAYEQLISQEDKDKFIYTHKTKNKLEYCETKGIPISETHYLLGLIYNDDLHWNPNRDYETPLLSKLENMTIKKMIKDIFL